MSICQTVKKASGTAAASSNEISAGIKKQVAGLNAHVLGIRVAFPLSHQAQAGAQVLAIGQTKFTNVAAGADKELRYHRV
jgi:hypothetical protein